MTNRPTFPACTSAIVHTRIGRCLVQLGTLATLSIAPAATARAQQAAPDPAFTFAETMIPMRDGVRLHTVYFVPKHQVAPLPILFVRTPYGVPGRDFPI